MEFTRRTQIYLLKPVTKWTNAYYFAATMLTSKLLICLIIHWKHMFWHWFYFRISWHPTSCDFVDHVSSSGKFLPALVCIFLNTINLVYEQSLWEYQFCMCFWHSENMRWFLEDIYWLTDWFSVKLQFWMHSAIL